MVFSSFVFLFRFLPVVLLAYYICPGSWRNLILFLSSLVFYAWGEPVYVCLILLSTVVDYVAGRVVDHFKGQGRLGFARSAVAASAVINLGLLAFFKYGSFVLENIHRFTGMAVPSLDLALPVGISFYTFQTMSYTIDVYRGDAKVQRNFISFGAYVALFPQLIAGPIIRYKSVAEQMNHRKETVDAFFSGLVRFMAGLGKKVLIANQIGELWNQIAATATGELTTVAAWLGVVAFTLQIYFDFSGYSDMAIGLGAMFGFSFPENFRYPYESKSITEFWRRWHISLGTWFREYVYIPLGGNRKGAARQMLNIAIVWLLTGLWHGAYWNFVLWGVYYGVLLVLEKCILKKVLDILPAWIGHIYTLCIVVAGWSIFAWQDMADAAGYMKTMLFHGSAGIVNADSLYLLISYAGLLVTAIVGATSLPHRVAAGKLFPEHTARRAVAGVLFILVMFTACVAMLVNSSYNPFLYFRF